MTAFPEVPPHPLSYIPPPLWPPPQHFCGPLCTLSIMASMSRSFLDASVPDLVNKLTTDEKIRLLGAPNWWNTHAIERLEIPAVRMSDGPNVCLLSPAATASYCQQGVRGSSHFVSVPAQCIPVCAARTILPPPSHIGCIAVCDSHGLNIRPGLDTPSRRLLS